MNRTPSEHVAEYLEEQASWRDRKARVYPYHHRNVEAATALRSLASHVRQLPESDPILWDLVSAGGMRTDGDAWVPTVTVAHACNRYGLNGSPPGAAAFLRRLVELAAADQASGD